jgi:hypothetical protein
MVGHLDTCNRRLKRLESGHLRGLCSDRRAFTYGDQGVACFSGS